MVHAPTPTAEPLDLPALLLATFPLDPTRRHVAAGPLTDHLVGLAGQAYAELARPPRPAALVPSPVPAGRLDAALRRASPPRCGRARPRPRRACAPEAVTVVGADDGLRVVLAEVLGPLVADRPALDALGVRRLGLADVVDALAAVNRPPAWWRQVYAALRPRRGG